MRSKGKMYIIPMDPWQLEFADTLNSYHPVLNYVMDWQTVFEDTYELAMGIRQYKDLRHTGLYNAFYTGGLPPERAAEAVRCLGKKFDRYLQSSLSEKVHYLNYDFSHIDGNVLCLLEKDL